MKFFKKIICVIFLSLVFANDNNEAQIERAFKSPGRIEALVADLNSNENLLLVQLDLINDSLFNLAYDNFPKMELWKGVSSYQRIIPESYFEKLSETLTDSYYKVLDSNYNYIENNNRLYWTLTKNGDQTQGTWSDDGAIEYTCSCLDGANNCVKLGWDEDWWNPLDYYGEAWWGFDPPPHDSVTEIRVTVRGGQCDALPVWSETYMGMRNNDGNWSEDYLLSIDYTDNEFIVGSNWSENMLMPIIGSEDNYTIDFVKLEFFYTCNIPQSPNNLLASDGTSCNQVELSWDSSPTQNVTSQKLYRDGQLIADLNSDNNSFTDFGALDGVEHIYCVEVMNDCGTSESSCNPGSRGTTANPAINVNATDGDYNNIVLLDWELLDSDILNQKIYRDNIWIALIGNNETQYTDIIPEASIIHNYCIEIINECGESEWSCDEGFVSSAFGDVNQDQNVDVIDVVIVVNLIIGLDEIDNYDIADVDLNNDSLINIVDIIILIDYIISL